jgi:hypothetical protein
MLDELIDVLSTMRLSFCFELLSPQSGIDLMA